MVYFFHWGDAAFWCILAQIFSTSCLLDSILFSYNVFFIFETANFFAFRRHLQRENFTLDFDAKNKQKISGLFKIVFFCLCDIIILFMSYRVAIIFQCIEHSFSSHANFAGPAKTKAVVVWSVLTNSHMTVFESLYRVKPHCYLN